MIKFFNVIDLTWFMIVHTRGNEVSFFKDRECSLFKGAFNIGNNVLIAPGAYVNFDVPDGSIVIGNPGLIRRSPGATLNYINNTILFDEYNVRSDGVKQW